MPVLLCILAGLVSFLAAGNFFGIRSIRKRLDSLDQVLMITRKVDFESRQHFLDEIGQLYIRIKELEAFLEPDNQKGVDLRRGFFRDIARLAKPLDELEDIVKTNKGG